MPCVPFLSRNRNRRRCVLPLLAPVFGGAIAPRQKLASLEDRTGLSELTNEHGVLGFAARVVDLSRLIESSIAPHNFHRVRVLDLNSTRSSDALLVDTTLAYLAEDSLPVLPPDATVQSEVASVPEHCQLGMVFATRRLVVVVDFAASETVARAKSSNARLAASMNMIAVVVCMLWLTERSRQRSKKLAEDRAQAAAERKVTHQLLRVISHDIRTPVYGLCAAFKSLWPHMSSTGENNEEVLQLKSIIESSSDILADLSGRFLEFSRLQNGHVDLDLQSTDLAGALMTVLRANEMVAREHGIALEFEALNKVPLVIADAKRVRQIALNLVGNALKFTPKGGRVLITLQSREDEQEKNVHVTIAVRDTGVGIPDDTVSLFLPYHQANALPEADCVDSTKKGVGLGLFIVKELVDLMGGTIGAYKRCGPDSTATGSVFEVSLRLQRCEAEAENPAVAEGSNAPWHKSPVQKAPPQETVECGARLIESRGGVLIADDVKANRFLLALRLKGLGITTIEEAEDGSDVLSMVRSRDFGCLFIDLQMIQMHGDETAQAIRSFYDDMAQGGTGVQEKRRLPVLVAFTADSVVGQGVMQWVPKREASGEAVPLFDFFLPKPHTTDELMDCFAGVASALRL